MNLKSMEKLVLTNPVSFLCLCMCISLLFGTSMAGSQNIGRISPGFHGTRMQWVDSSGIFLLSNNSVFGFGFVSTNDPTMYLLATIHLSSKTAIWSANNNYPVVDSVPFVFNKTGNAYLANGNSVIWSTNTSGRGVSAIELQDSGNLVLLGSGGSIIWQSFDHPTDTLISSQEFSPGMKLNNQRSNNLSYILEMKSGDMVLSVGYRTPQPYWTARKDTGSVINKLGGELAMASIEENAWRFYDENRTLLWQFKVSDNTDPNATLIAVLGADGILSFHNLQSGGKSLSRKKIPDDQCSTPQPCDPYSVCYNNNICRCLPAMPKCGTGIVSPCDQPKGGPTTDLVNAGDGIEYFALNFVSPSQKGDLSGCKEACLNNCSCLALFFHNSSGNCFMFDQIGALKSTGGNSGYVSYIKVSSDGGGSVMDPVGSQNDKKYVPYIVIIVVSTFFVVLGLVYGGLWYHRRKKKLPEGPKYTSDEEEFLESFPGMPIRFSYRDLEIATSNFSVKLGHGGFGSVYQGALPDGTRVAVKKLEGIGQGKKEFRAEVRIIGSIHHLHLVRLKGFCAEGTHRLLAYEYMAKGSLDKWIFGQSREDRLDWQTRYNIALGTAKGLAYLHEDCDAKIVHCDIKPENMLLDDNFHAKVSDFGLAKLMTREQSHVFTTLRGTRGYLAPEWITNYAISEKSDVYSFGMVLLEIIGGRKSYDPTESSEKSHFPSYAFKMMEEGRLREILDSRLEIDGSDETLPTAIKVALWCIQEDMHLRPPMAKVVQMLEGVCSVPQPPLSSPLGFRIASSFFRLNSEENTSSGLSEGNSEAHLSAVRLSGPR